MAAHKVLPFVLGPQIILMALLSLVKAEIETSPSFFLTEDEVLSSRRGDVRWNISLSTQGNRVEPLIDGVNFYTALYHEFEQVCPQRVFTFHPATPISPPLC